MAEPFLYTHPEDHLHASATPSVETGTEVAGYEAEFLTDFSDGELQHPALIVETTGAFMLEFAAAQKLAGLVLWHNGKEDLVLYVEGNASDSWGGSPGPPSQIEITLPAKRGDGSTEKVFVDFRADGWFSTGYKFLRVHFPNANDQPLGLKVLPLARVRQLSVDVTWGVRNALTRPTIKLPTESGHAWTYDLQTTPRQRRGKLLNISDADDALITAYLEATGPGLTVVVAEPNAELPLAWIARLLSDGDGFVALHNDSSYDAPDTHTRDLEWEEETAGGPEWT